MIYRVEKKSLYVVARMFQASPGRSDKLQQEQTSPNHVQELFLSSVVCPDQLGSFKTMFCKHISDLVELLLAPTEVLATQFDLP